MEDEKAFYEDPLIMVYLRNEFYKKKFYLALSVCALSVFVTAILIGMLVYIVQNPTAPRYFPANDLSELIQDVPLDQPNMSQEDATAWTIEAVEAAYSYDYMNYRAQLQSTQKYFSPYGLHKFLQGLSASKNLVALTQRKLIIIAKVIGQPQVQAGVLKTGAYGYKYQMQLLVTYKEPPYTQKSFQNALNVSVVVQRMDLLRSYKGLGIMQMIGSFNKQAPDTNMNTQSAR